MSPTAPRIIDHFIGGKHVPGRSNRFGAIFNPATGDVIAKVPMATADEVHHTVQVAKQAFIGWSATPPLRRARILFRFKELMEQHAEEIAAIVSREHGKLLNDARGSVTRGLEVIEFVCGAPHLLKGTFSEDVGTGIDCHAIRQPLGVCAGITPFNFPAMVPLWMFPVAVACGNTFILKPSEKVPSASMRMAELWKEAGAPDGVLNVIHGDKEAVDALLTHSDVTAISFVGSTPVAEYIYQTACAHGKRAQALGGAKNHMVIMPDADMEQAVEALLGAAYGSAGERCMAISVAVAVGAAGDALINHLVPRVRALRVGTDSDAKSPQGTEAEMGPLISREHCARVRSYVDLGIQEGAKLLVDGRDVRVPGHDGGFFLGASLFDHVTPTMRVYQEEIFGPVLCVVRVPDLATAMALVNDHPYGNGTAIFTRDGGTARQYAHRVKVGMVGINIPLPVPMAYHSFGGWKRSLFGDVHMHGPEGIQFYTKLKTITTRWPAVQDTSVATPPSGSVFAMPTMR